MDNDEFKRIDEECRKALDHPSADELSEEPEFEEIVYFENGQQKTVRRKNPKHKPSATE